MRTANKKTSNLSASSLNSRVSLQRKTGRDALGQPLNTWTEYAQCWAAILQLSGKENAKQGETTATQGNASIRVRYRVDVSNGDRVVDLSDGITFNIAAILPNVASRQYTDLVCTSGANEGG